MANNNKAKAPIILLILIILLLGSLGLAGVTFYYLQKEQLKNSTLQDELTDIKAKYTSTLSKLDDSKKTIMDLENRIAENNMQIESLREELETKSTENQKALSRASQLERALEDQKGLGYDLQKKLMQVQRETENLKQRITDLNTEKEQLETKLTEMEDKIQGVELGKIVVSPESLEEGYEEILEVQEEVEEPELVVEEEVEAQERVEKKSNQLEGKVLVVNKEYDFVVIDLGKNNGVEEGELFRVYQGKKYIGDLKIEKIHESMSAAGFRNRSLKKRISEGDRVVRKKAR